MSKLSYQKSALQYLFDSEDYIKFLAKIKFWVEHIDFALKELVDNFEVLTQ